MSRRLAVPALEAWSRELLAAAGLEAQAAADVAETLADASVRGVDSHGVARTAIYAARLRTGALNGRPRPRVERREGALALVDGDSGPGQVAGRLAVDLAAELAEAHGVGAVAVRRSGHFGAAGWYAVRAARRGLIALATCNSDPFVVAHGGAHQVLGTNPIAVAAPTSGAPFVVDMATSQVAWNKVVNAQLEGRTLEPGWAVDADGHPTTDPQRAAAGVPLGGHKGYALAVAVEVLSAVLSGAGVTRRAGALFGEDERQDVGHLFLALDPERTIGRGAFVAALEALLAELRAATPVEGVAEVLVPGDPEARAEAERRRDGVPVPDALWDQLAGLSRELGVVVPATG